MKVDTARFVPRVRQRVIEHMYFAALDTSRMIASSKLKSSKLPTLYIKHSTPRARKRFRSHNHFPPSPAGPSPAGPLFARARHGGLHVVLVPTVGPLRASARDGVEKRVALELIGVDRAKHAIEGDIDVFCDRRRTRRLRLYARVLFFDPSTGLAR